MLTVEVDTWKPTKRESSITEDFPGACFLLHTWSVSNQIDSHNDFRLVSNLKNSISCRAKDLSLEALSAMSLEAYPIGPWRLYIRVSFFNFQDGKECAQALYALAVCSEDQILVDRNEDDPDRQASERFADQREK